MGLQLTVYGCGAIMKRGGKASAAAASSVRIGPPQSTLSATAVYATRLDCAHHLRDFMGSGCGVQMRERLIKEANRANRDEAYG
jgi:hypothetical protein